MVPTEIKALARIISDLDYYQLLHLNRDAGTGDVKKAYHATSRAFHPDANRHLDSDLRRAVSDISKRISEAYSVLRNPRRRQAYDRHLESGEGVRMQLSEAEAEAGRQDSEARGGRTPQGKQFYRLATGDLQRKDYASAVRNLQTALTFEPNNPVFKTQLAEAKEKFR
jgi:curved DNA-binding protein CbpA